MTDEIQKAEFQKSTSDVLRRTLTQLAQGLTGILAAEKHEVVLSVGRLFQAMVAGQFLDEFLKDWEKYRDKGRIKEDYEVTEQHKSCLQEMLNFLDKDTADETRFAVLKKIFLVAATETASDRDSHLPLQYMQIARTLTSGEILVLNAEYIVATRKRELWEGKLQPYSAHAWLEIIAKVSGLEHPELVETHEEELMKKNLLLRRAFGDRSGVFMHEHLRLTKLGYELCRYIENYTE